MDVQSLAVLLQRPYRSRFVLAIGVLALAATSTARAVPPPSGESAAAEAVASADWLSTPEARKERLESRTAYHGRLGLGAHTVAAQHFGPTVTGPLWSQPKLPAGLAKAAMHGDRVMVLAQDGQPAGIATSAIPLQTKTASGSIRPTDLSLIATDSGYAPANSPEPAVIGKAVGDGVYAPTVGLRVTPRMDAPTTTGALTDGRVFYADASTDTDVIAGASPTGAQILFQLRSPQSPTSLTLDLGLPSGVTVGMASDGSGAAQLVHAGRIVGIVQPPMAEDAQGQVVPAHYTVAGDHVVVDVDHASGDYAYPILVDPVVDWQLWHLYPTQAVSGWTYVTPWSGSYLPSTGGSWGSGLYSVMGFGKSYASGTWGEWQYLLSGTQFLYALSFAAQKQAQANPANYPECMSFGLANTSGGWDTSAQWIGWSGGSGAAPRVRCGAFDNQSPTVTGANVCLRSDCQPPATHQPNYGAFQQWAYGTGVRDGWNISHVGETLAYITDPDNPTISGGPFSSIVATGESFAYTATDPGLGVYSVSFESPGNPSWDRAQTRTNSCSGANWDPCPASENGTVGYGNLPSGDQPIRMTVTDAGGRSSSASWTAHIYPTSVRYGGANRSIDTLTEAQALVNGIQAASVPAGDDLWWGVSPTDRSYVDAADLATDPQQGCREAYWDDPEGYVIDCEHEDQQWDDDDPSPFASSAWSIYKQLNSKERAYCRTHGFQCKRFHKDRKRAQKYARALFTGPGTEDNTKANAFKHAYWVALMTDSAGGSSLQGLEFSRAHEYSDYYDAFEFDLPTNSPTRRSSRMDVINDRVGYWYTVNHQSASLAVMCKDIFERANSAGYIGADADPFLWYEQHGYASDLSYNDPISEVVFRRSYVQGTSTYVTGTGEGSARCDS